MYNTADLGLSYDFDDQHSADVANNRMETVNVLEHMYKEMADLPCEFYFFPFLTSTERI